MIVASSIAFFQLTALPARHRLLLCLALAWLPAAWAVRGAATTQAGLAPPKQETPRVTAPPPVTQPELLLLLLLLLDVTINQQRLSDVVGTEYWPDGILLLLTEPWRGQTGQAVLPCCRAAVLPCYWAIGLGA